MAAEAFAVGERVQLKEAHFGFLAGSSGTIVYQFAGVSDVYRVRLDADGLVRSIPRAKLSREIPTEIARVVGEPLG